MNFQKWIIKADNDLKTAMHELSFDENEVVTEAVCFHSQQAVEKYLKAYLVFKNYDFGRTHNLEFLQQLCAKFDETFLSLDFGDLTNYAISIRYPDEFYIPDIKEAKKAYEIAKGVKNFVLNKIKGD